MSENGIELKVGDTIYVTEKGLEEVVVTKISDHSNNIFWADNHGYEHSSPTCGSQGSLLRALFLGHNAFMSKEKAKNKLRLDYINQIQTLLVKLEQVNSL